MCEDCRLLVKPAELVCPVCFYPSLSGERHFRCEGPLDGLVGVFEYEGVVRKAIHLLKFKGLRSLASELVFLSGKRFDENSYEYGRFAEFLFSPEAGLTFVPMRRRREKKRGYNQAEIIAREVARLSGKEPLSLLEKSKATEPQVELDGRKRLENLKGSFSFSGSYIPKRVVLVDDVVTTGSTLNECARVLKEAGVEKVWGFTIAKTRSLGG